MKYVSFACVQNWHVGIAWTPSQYGNIRTINIPASSAQLLDFSYK